MIRDVYVVPRFKRVLTLHVLKNMLRIPDIQIPLILGIHGPSGEGKTFQCEHVLKELDVRMYLISGGQMESPEAGRPAELIREIYLRAGKDIREGKCTMGALLINDFDTGIGDWGELVQYTVNRQTVFAELMHIADFPENVENQETTRIPIIITGNNFLRLHEPLVRFGRMWLFEWKPTIEEKIRIVESIFPTLEKSESECLVLSCKEQPIAFFSLLKSTLLDDSLWDLIEKSGTEEVITKIKEGMKTENLEVTYKFEKLLNIAEEKKKDLLFDNTREGGCQ